MTPRPPSTHSLFGSSQFDGQNSSENRSTHCCVTGDVWDVDVRAGRRVLQSVPRQGIPLLTPRHVSRAGEGSVQSSFFEPQGSQSHSERSLLLTRH